MSTRFSIFPSVAGDRINFAADFLQRPAQETFAGTGDGVSREVGNSMQVIETSPASLAVDVDLGVARVDGWRFEVFTSAETVTLDTADGTNPRIDRIVVRARTDSTNRDVILDKLTGTPASSPVPPSLTRVGDVYEISLAQVFVGANVTAVTNEDITDERGDNTVCGFLRAQDTELFQGLTPSQVAGLGNFSAETSVLDLETIPLIGVVSVNGFLEGRNDGGGLFFADASRSQSEADGITVIDPTSFNGFDGTVATLEQYYDPASGQGSGTGTGVWVRVLDQSLITCEMAGCVPNDGTDNNPLSSATDTRPLQRAIDVAAENNLALDFSGGEFQTTFILLVRSNSHWQGTGSINNVGTSASGINNSVLSPGGWRSQNTTEVTDFGLNAVTAGDRTVTTTTASNAGNFSPGDFVFVRSEGGYDFNTTFIPDFAQLNQVISSDSVTGNIVLEDAIAESISTPQIHAAEDDTITTPEGYPLTVCAFSVIEGVSMRSTNGHVFRRGGMYKSSFSFPFTDSLISAGLNTVTHSDINIGSSTYEQRVCEFALNSHNATLNVKEATYRDSGSDSQHLLISENTINSVVNVGSISATENVGTTAIAELNGCRNCQIKIDTLLAPNLTATNAILTRHVDRTQFGTRTLIQQRTELSLIQASYVLFGSSVGRAFNFGADTTNNRLETSYFSSPSFTTGQAVGVDGDRNVISEGVYADSGVVRIAGGNTSTNNIIRGYFEDGLLNQSDQGDRNDIDISSRSWSALKAREGITQTGGGTTTSDTTPNNTIEFITIPSSTLEFGDRIRVLVAGTLSGSNGNKNFRLRRDGVENIVSLTGGAAATGEYLLEMLVSVQSNPRLASFGHAEFGFSGQSRVISGGLDLDANGLVLALNAWVENAADSITIDILDFKMERFDHV